MMLNDISAYKIAFALTNYVWFIILKWNFFEKDTVGKQFVRAVDSISANIAEGFRRYSKKEKIHFYRYSFGSLKKSQDWNEKSRIRNLLTKEEYEQFNNLTVYEDVSNNITNSIYTNNFFQELPLH